MKTLIKLLDSLRRHGAVLAIALLCAGTGLVHAQTASDDNVDPPSRVARLSWIAGDLGLLPAGARDWSDASINRPLTTGDKLSSGADARAELEFGGATLRLDNRTDLGLLDLNEQLAQIELTQGTLSLSVHRLDEGQSYEIDTPTVALVIDQPGRFRMDIDGNATRVTVLEGKATVYGENDAQRDVFAGRSYRFADSSLAAVGIREIGGSDDFDAWVYQRDQRYAQSSSSQYVSPDVVGYQDLDQYGDWQDSGDYGAVWYPRTVAVGWAPYRDGRWAYIAPWGWTWIDAAPWGYAPYHYGRWAHTHRGWGWVPGPRYARPIYAPALVAFVGGGGFSVGIGSGPVGWFPLGPGEIYNPWYRSNRDYYRRVNVSNIRVTRNITNVTINNRINTHYAHYRQNQPLADERYANRRVPGGLSAMPGREFAAGRRVQRNLVKVDRRQWETAKVIPRGVDVRPLPAGRDSQHSTHVRQLPVDGFQREVVARRAPPAMPERRVDPGDQLAGPQQHVVPRPNVRLLNQSRVDRPERYQADQPSPLQRRTPSVIANTPPVQRGPDPITPARQERLPSARFAHPRDRNHDGERAAMPRPGVSYISGGDQKYERPPSRDDATLPQVPQIRRADTASRPDDTIREQRVPRYPANQPRDIAPERSRPAPRFERTEAVQPAYVREQAPTPPAFREAPRLSRPTAPSPRQEQPQYTQPPRATPPPQMAAPPRETPSPRSEKPRPRHADARQEQQP